MLTVHWQILGPTIVPNFFRYFVSKILNQNRTSRRLYTISLNSGITNFWSDRVKLSLTAQVRKNPIIHPVKNVSDM